MTEIRTTSSTGGEKGVKPERHDLIPRRAMAAIARVFGFGATKYADHNWRRGYEWGKSIAALQRHVDAFVEGETYDSESGEPHLAHAGFHILVLLTWLEEQGEGVENVMDDRWMHAMERVRLAKETEATSAFATDSSALRPTILGRLLHGAPEYLHDPEPSVGPDLLSKRRPTMAGEAAQAYMTQGRLKD